MAKSLITANLISGLQRDVRTLQEELTTLRGQLDEFGGHKAECAIESRRLCIAQFGEDPGEAECDCGWDKVKRKETNDKNSKS